MNRIVGRPTRGLGYVVASALALCSLLGCASDTAEGTSEDPVVVERARLDELIRLNKQATEKSVALERSIGPLVGLRDLASALPALDAVNGLLRDLDPLLRLLKDRLSASAPDELRRQGFTDVPDLEYRALIARVEGIVSTLSGSIKTLQSDIVSFGDASHALSDTQREQLRAKIGEYTEKVFGVGSELQKVTDTLADWLDAAGKDIPLPDGAMTVKTLPLHLVTDFAEDDGPTMSDLRARLDRYCATMRSALTEAFPATLDDFDCGERVQNRKDFESKGTASFRIPESAEQKTALIVGPVANYRIEDSRAANLWMAKCEEFLRNVQTLTVPSRKVVGATCGVPKRVEVHHFESQATFFTVRVR